MANCEKPKPMPAMCACFLAVWNGAARRSAYMLARRSSSPKDCTVRMPATDSATTWPADSSAFSPDLSAPVKTTIWMAPAPAMIGVAASTTSVRRTSASSAMASPAIMVMPFCTSSAKRSPARPRTSIASSDSRVVIAPVEFFLRSKKAMSWWMSDRKVRSRSFATRRSPATSKPYICQMDARKAETASAMNISAQNTPSSRISCTSVRKKMEIISAKMSAKAGICKPLMMAPVRPSSRYGHSDAFSRSSRITLTSTSMSAIGSSISSLSSPSLLNPARLMVRERESRRSADEPDNVRSRATGEPAIAAAPLDRVRERERERVRSRSSAGTPSASATASSSSTASRPCSCARTSAA
mmetsp:Transcript_1909/g.6051  ORF Transcript_1909/g.6051 Transcript_1909/m.6051 type:complete len:356 (-) Transcript_1909:2255-3322(-)